MIDLNALKNGDRRTLARAITLAESSRTDDQKAIQHFLDKAGAPTQTPFKLAVSGPPGVGKSTFIDALGHHLIHDHQQRVAVLAIDPTSPKSGGSILGDKVRMPRIAHHPNAFVRPSPTNLNLGGVTKATPLVIHLLSLAGFDAIIVETVGVGQSEYLASLWVDCFLLLLSPGAGDELQGIKRGVMEIADVVGITKNDGDHQRLAQTTLSHVESALRLLRGQSPPPARLLSEKDDSSIAAVWQACQEHNRSSQANNNGSTNHLEHLAKEWLWNRALEHPDLSRQWQQLQSTFNDGDQTNALAIIQWIQQIRMS